MKQFINALIAFSIAFSPLAVHAGNGAPANGASSTEIRAADYKKAVGNVTYSLQTMPEVINDVRVADQLAGRGVTKTSSQEIYTRLTAALELMHIIAADPKMTDAEKDAVQLELFVNVGQAMYRVLRQHGNDRLNATGDNEPIPEISWNGQSLSAKVGNAVSTAPAVVWNRIGLIMKEFLLDARSLGTFVRSGDFKKTVSAEDRAAILRREARRDELVEMIEDLKKAGKPEPAAITAEVQQLDAQKKADDASFKLIWKPLERVNRTRTGEQVIDGFAQLADTYVPRMVDGSSGQHHYLKFWAERHIPQMTVLRSNRLGAQKAMKFMLIGMSVASFITPDFIGMVEGRSDWSRPVTSVILITSFAILAKIKGATISTKIVAELNELLAIIKGTASYVQADRLAKGWVETLKSKLAGLRDVAAVNAIVAPISLGRGAQCPALFR